MKPKSDTVKSVSPAPAGRGGPALAYPYRNALYLNITPRCPTACEFCIKFTWDYLYRSHNLLLKREPSVEEVLKAAGDPSRYSEVVFCGYGESTYRLEAMREISERLRRAGAKKMRLNTIGLGNLIQKRDITPDLESFLDEVSVSLNTTEPEEWMKLHRPLPEFRERGFQGVLDFIRACARRIPATYVTAVELPGFEREKFGRFVQSLGARLRVRPYLGDYESE